MYRNPRIANLFLLGDKRLRQIIVMVAIFVGILPTLLNTYATKDTEPYLLTVFYPAKTFFLKQNPASSQLVL